MFFRSKENKAAASQPKAEAASLLENGKAVATDSSESRIAVEQVASEVQDIRGEVAPEESASAAITQPELPAEELRKFSAQAKRGAASFGEIVGVLMRTKEYRGLRLAELEKLIVPALGTGQFLIAEAQSKTNGMSAPVATIIYALVSDEIDQRLSTELSNPVPLILDRKDWNSGENAWVVVAAGDQRLIGNMLKNLQESVFKDRPIKSRVREGNDGEVKIVNLRATANA
ncbi:MAG: toxin-activating lysine-acyltransferase [Pseudomonadota bacterium]